MTEARRRTWSRNRLALLTAFAVALGYLWALSTIYLHRILDLSPLEPDLGPGLMPEGPDWLISTQQTAQAALIILLIVLAMLAGRRTTEKLGIFLLTAGLSTLIRYGSLLALTNWSLTWITTDCLLWLPRPRYGPIWIAAVTAAVMVVLGVILTRKPSH